MWPAKPKIFTLCPFTETLPNSVLETWHILQVWNPISFPLNLWIYDLLITNRMWWISCCMIDPKVNVWGRILQIPWSYPLQASSVFYGLQAHQVKPGYNGACMSSILSPHIATYIQKLLLKLCKSGYCHHDCWTILENLVLWFMKTQHP